MDRLILDNVVPEFPHLPMVWRHCVVQGAMKADLWRLLVLYEYGGIFADLDSPPNNFNLSTILKTDQALFVVDKDGTASFHFIAVKPKHPVIQKALHLAISMTISIWDTAKCNPVAITGPATLRGAIGEFILSEFSEEDRQKLGFRMGQSLLPGVYKGRSGQIRILENPNGDINYWIQREQRLAIKRHLYDCMNMSHFMDVMVGPGTGLTCIRAMWNEINTTGVIALPDLVNAKGAGDDVTKDCPYPMVAVPTQKFGNNMEALKKKRSQIPRIIHQASSTRCKSPSEAAKIKKWSDLGYDYYLHDLDAMDQLVLSTVGFPNLRVIWNRTTFDEKLLLWHYLVLWEYGGIYADINSFPNNFNPQTVQPSDKLLVILNATGNENSNNFLAAVPRHPSIYTTLQDAIKDLVVGNRQNAFRALSETLRMTVRQRLERRRKGVRDNWAQSLKPNRGFDQDSGFRILGNDESYWITTSTPL